MVLCRIFHTAPEQGQGLTPIVLVLVPVPVPVPVPDTVSVNTPFTDLVFLLTDGSLCDQFLRVLDEARLHLFDFLVHERLREHRLVDLVVPVLPVTNLPNKTMVL